MEKILRDLLSIADKTYADFSAKLTPNIDREKFLGVRVPVLRNYAKKLDDKEAEKFLNELPHRYFDENMLHGLIISEIKDYSFCVEKLTLFLPYVDNWAVCDIMSPKVFSKNKDKLIFEIKKFLVSDKTYTIRFGIGMLLKHFADENFSIEYLEMVAGVKSDEYYVNMMIAWYFATLLCKHYKETIVYLENKTLSAFVHNKAIQKAIESYRITDEQKNYLRTLKIK